MQEIYQEKDFEKSTRKMLIVSGIWKETMNHANCEFDFSLIKKWEAWKKTTLWNMYLKN